MIPDSTSPLPPVASPGLPAATVSTEPAAQATTVGTPLSSTVTLVDIGRAMRRFPRRRLEVLRILGKERAEFADVRCADDGPLRRQAGTAPRLALEHDRARRRRPRALRACASTASTNAVRSAVRPRPGPTITASARSSNSIRGGCSGAVNGCASVCMSGSASRMVASDSSGATTCSRPAPAPKAARAAIRAAPVIAGEPPTTTTCPAGPLVAVGRERRQAVGRPIAADQDRPRRIGGGQADIDDHETADFVAGQQLAAARAAERHGQHRPQRAMMHAGAEIETGRSVDGHDRAGQIDQPLHQRRHGAARRAGGSGSEQRVDRRAQCRATGRPPARCARRRRSRPGAPRPPARCAAARLRWPTPARRARGARAR